MQDHTNGRLQEIKEFAKTTTVEQTLLDSLDRLELMAENRGYDNEKYEVLLGADFAPMSLCFCIAQEGKPPVFNGGLIYHGTHDGHGSGSAPSFSVTVDKSDGWRIHT